MSVIRKREYGSVRLLDVECDAPEEWTIGDATHLRVCMPTSYENISEMVSRGFFLADRLLDVSIALSRSKLDYSKLVRLEPRITSQCRDQILEIAQRSFPSDRRFHLSLRPDEIIAQQVLAGWINELPEYYLCEHKGEPIGFLALTGEGNRRFIHLAAVLERYRASGAALSLYAAAARDCKNQGIQFLDGRVSSANPAVLNLYAFLGANFSHPQDVYLKEL